MEGDEGQRKTFTTRAEGQAGSVSVKIELTPRAGEQTMKERYGVEKYELGSGFSVSDSLRSLVPTSVPDYVDEGENYVSRIMRALYFFRQCALIGPSGTGKTHIVYLVAKIAGLPLWEINCGLQTSVYDLFGRFVGLGRENWIDGQIVSWCRYGGILYLDEANMMKQDIATRLNPILDTRGHMVLTEKDNEVIPRHPFGYVVISMNPYAAEFAGTKPLNAAFRRRMSVWVDFDYLSVGSKVSSREVGMISERGKIEAPVAERLVRVAAEMRKRYKTGDLPYAPSVGDLINWATLVADGLTPAAAAEETVISMTSDDAEIQAGVRRIVHMIAGSDGGVKKPLESA
ncbi:MAG: AAA family ATPase [Nitrososphaerota archaeon]|nr:AAA family ATPase [Nitrososphaerota archaeon]